MTHSWRSILLLVYGTLTSWAFAEGVAFPSVSTNVSPNRLWEIRSEPDKTNEGTYNLILRNRKIGAERRIFSGDRWCEVLWAPLGDKIAITDWLGSNCSEVLLQSTNEQKTAKPLADAAARAFLTKDELVGHCYSEALSWEKGGQLRIRVFGHTDENPGHEFAYEFIFDPDKKSARLLKKDNAPNSRAEQRIWAEKEQRRKKR
jgi:hypothetical protein